MLKQSQSPADTDMETAGLSPVECEYFPDISSRRQQRAAELSPYISCTVSRLVNIGAEEEYFDVKRYQRELGLANDGYEEQEDGSFVPRYELDDKHSSLVKPDKLHVTHLFAADIGEVMLRAFADDRGRIIKPREVARRLTRFTKKYNTLARRHNENLQDALMFDKGYTMRGPRRSLGEDELDDANLRMTNGMFELSDTLGVFGRGNAFGLRFAPSARNFLQSERMRALDIFTDTIGLTRLDNDIEDRIISAEHHVTLLRLGFKLPEWEIYLPPSKFKLMPVSFVTDFDPKARAILPNGD